MTEIQESDLCCCGSGVAFGQCCGPLLAGKPAPTAEALMRSRYSAFVCGRMDYLKETLALEAREDYNPEETEQWVKKSRWLGLDIRTTTGGGAKDSEGTVGINSRRCIRKRWKRPIIIFILMTGVLLYMMMSA